MKRMPKLFGQADVDSAINAWLIPNGYEINPLEDCLVTGYVCVPPDDNHCYFIILPHYLNEWDSALEIHRYRSWDTVPKKTKAIIKAYEEREEN